MTEVSRRTGILSLELERTKPQRVGDDGDRAEAHRGAGQHWTQKPAEEWIQCSGRDGNSECVIEKCEEQILLDVANRGPAQPARPNDSAQISFQQGDPCAFDRDVGAGAHRDADVGGGE